MHGNFFSATSSSSFHFTFFLQNLEMLQLDTFFSGNLNTAKKRDIFYLKIL